MTIKYSYQLPSCVEKRIIIVGGGIAGLFCAKELKTYGFNNVLLLEAENRLGGRIHTISADFIEQEDNTEKLFLEFGPQRIHRGSNSIYEFAEYREQLGKVTPDYCDVLKNLNTTHTGEDESIICGLANYFTHLYYFPKNWEQILGSEEFRKEFRQHDQTLINYYAKGVYDWHRGFLYEFSFLPAELKTNFHSFLDLLWQSIPLDWILMNKEVVNIDWTQLIPKIAKKSRNPIIKVLCRNETTYYEADHVIITVPLGYLKQNVETLFEPSLPDYKINAIKSLDFVTLNKIYLLFDDPLWQKPEVYHVIWNKDLERLFDYEDDSNEEEEKWVHCITHFEYVPKHPHLLLAFIWNEGAEIMENKSSHTVITYCMKLLEHLLQKSLPMAKSIIRSSWHSDPLYYGSLPYDPSRDAGDDILKIAESVFGGVSGNQPVLLFAGDATNKVDIACAHGAAASGVRAANIIHNYYRYGYKG